MTVAAGAADDVEHLIRKLMKLTMSRKAEEEFVKLDIGQDGAVTLSELQAGMRRIGLATSPSAVQDMFEKMDMDHNGTISCQEFTDFCMKRRQALYRVFQELDTDNSGGISSSELRAVMDTLHLKASSEDIALLMKRLDLKRAHPHLANADSLAP